ncbi:mechanosensitive ion channel family protein [candidate division KSB1 bacterium]
MDMNSMIQNVYNWLITSGIRILFIVIITAAGLKIAKLVFSKIFSKMKKEEATEFNKRIETLRSILNYILTISILILSAIIILSELGIDIGPILAAAGILGLAVGFGAQNLVKDIISGFFILIEDQIRVGDVVQISGKSGLVEKVNLRMTILRDVAGSVHYVRNGDIDVVTNMTKDFSFYVFDIGIAYRENVDEVIGLIREVSDEIRANPDYQTEILDSVEILGLDKFADSAVIIKARIKTIPVKQWRVGREFNRLLKKKFDEKDIEIPFPHMTLYMGQDKDGSSPPLNIKNTQS